MYVETKTCAVPVVVGSASGDSQPASPLSIVGRLEPTDMTLFAALPMNNVAPNWTLKLKF